MVGSRNDTKRHRKNESPQDTQPKRTKVHAQRKFAQGAGGGLTLTPMKDKEKPRSNTLSAFNHGGNTNGNTNGPAVSTGPSSNGSGNTIPTASAASDVVPTPSSKRPSTEDFLTFLCFHRTNMLPDRLQFFSNAPQQELDEDGNTAQDTHPSRGSRSTDKNKEHGATGGNRRSPIKAPTATHKAVTAAQALKKKYQDQRLKKTAASTHPAFIQKGTQRLRTTRSGALIVPAVKGTIVGKNTPSRKEACSSSAVSKKKVAVSLKAESTPKKPVKSPANVKSQPNTPNSSTRGGLRSGGPPHKLVALRAQKSAERSKPVAKPAQKKVAKGAGSSLKPIASSMCDFSSEDDQPLVKKKKPLMQARKLLKKSIASIGRKLMLEPRRSRRGSGPSVGASPTGTPATRQKARLKVPLRGTPQKTVDGNSTYGSSETPKKKDGKAQPAKTPAKTKVDAKETRDPPPNLKPNSKTTDKKPLLPKMKKGYVLELVAVSDADHTQELSKLRRTSRELKMKAVKLVKKITSPEPMPRRSAGLVEEKKDKKEVKKKEVEKKVKVKSAPAKGKSKEEEDDSDEQKPLAKITRRTQIKESSEEEEKPKGRWTNPRAKKEATSEEDEDDSDEQRPLAKITRRTQVKESSEQEEKPKGRWSNAKAKKEATSEEEDESEEEEKKVAKRSGRRGTRRSSVKSEDSSDEDDEVLDKLRTRPKRSTRQSSSEDEGLVERKGLRRSGRQTKNVSLNEESDESDSKLRTRSRSAKVVSSDDENEGVKPRERRSAKQAASDVESVDEKSRRRRSTKPVSTDDEDEKVKTRERRSTKAGALSDKESADEKPRRGRSMKPVSSDDEHEQSKTREKRFTKPVVSDGESESVKAPGRRSAKPVSSDVESADEKPRARRSAKPALSDDEGEKVKTRERRSTKSVLSDVESAEEKSRGRKSIKPVSSDGEVESEKPKQRGKSKTFSSDESDAKSSKTVKKGKKASLSDEEDDKKLKPKKDEPKKEVKGTVVVPMKRTSVSRSRSTTEKEESKTDEVKDEKKTEVKDLGKKKKISDSEPETVKSKLRKLTPKNHRLSDSGDSDESVSSTPHRVLRERKSYFHFEEDEFSDLEDDLLEDLKSPAPAKKEVLETKTEVAKEAETKRAEVVKREADLEKKSLKKEADLEKKNLKKEVDLEKRNLKKDTDSEKKMLKKEADSEKKTLKKEADSEKKNFKKEADLEKKSLKKEADLEKKYIKKEVDPEKKNLKKEAVSEKKNLKKEANSEKNKVPAKESIAESKEVSKTEKRKVPFAKGTASKQVSGKEKKVIKAENKVKRTAKKLKPTDTKSNEELATAFEKITLSKEEDTPDKAVSKVPPAVSTSPKTPQPDVVEPVTVSTESEVREDDLPSPLSTLAMAATSLEDKETEPVPVPAPVPVSTPVSSAPLFTPVPQPVAPAKALPPLTPYIPITVPITTEDLTLMASRTITSLPATSVAVSGSLPVFSPVTIRMPTSTSSPMTTGTPITMSSLQTTVPLPGQVPVMLTIPTPTSVSTAMSGVSSMLVSTSATGSSSLIIPTSTTNTGLGALQGPATIAMSSSNQVTGLAPLLTSGMMQTQGATLASMQAATSITSSQLVFIKPPDKKDGTAVHAGMPDPTIATMSPVVLGMNPLLINNRNPGPTFFLSPTGQMMSGLSIPPVLSLRLPDKTGTPQTLFAGTQLYTVPIAIGNPVVPATNQTVVKGARTAQFVLASKPSTVPNATGCTSGSAPLILSVGEDGSHLLSEAPAGTHIMAQGTTTAIWKENQYVTTDSSGLLSVIPTMKSAVPTTGMIPVSSSMISQDVPTLGPVPNVPQMNVTLPPTIVRPATPITQNMTTVVSSTVCTPVSTPVIATVNPTLSAGMQGSTLVTAPTSDMSKPLLKPLMPPVTTQTVVSMTSMGSVPTVVSMPTAIPTPTVVSIPSSVSTPTVVSMSTVVPPPTVVSMPTSVPTPTVVPVPMPINVPTPTVVSGPTVVSSPTVSTPAVVSTPIVSNPTVISTPSVSVSTVLSTSNVATPTARSTTTIVSTPTVASTTTIISTTNLMTPTVVSTPTVITTSSVVSASPTLPTTSTLTTAKTTSSNSAVLSFTAKVSKKLKRDTTPSSSPTRSDTPPMKPKPKTTPRPSNHSATKAAKTSTTVSAEAALAAVSTVSKSHTAPTISTKSTLNSLPSKDNIAKSSPSVVTATVSSDKKEDITPRAATHSTLLMLSTAMKKNDPTKDQKREVVAKKSPDVSLKKAERKDLDPERSGLASLAEVASTLAERACTPPSMPDKGGKGSRAPEHSFWTNPAHILGRETLKMPGLPLTSNLGVATKSELAKMKIGATLSDAVEVKSAPKKPEPVVEKKPKVDPKPEELKPPSPVPAINTASRVRKWLNENPPEEAERIDETIVEDVSNLKSLADLCVSMERITDTTEKKPEVEVKEVVEEVKVEVVPSTPPKESAPATTGPLSLSMSPQTKIAWQTAFGVKSGANKNVKTTPKKKAPGSPSAAGALAKGPATICERWGNLKNIRIRQGAETETEQTGAASKEAAKPSKTVEGSTPSHREESQSSSSNEEAPSVTIEKKCAATSRRSFLHRMNERKDPTPSANAFSVSNESSVYAFEADPELPPVSKPFRRRSKTSRSEEDLTRLSGEEDSSCASTSTSIAVQVNMDSVPAAARVPAPPAESPVKVIPSKESDSRGTEISTQTEGTTTMDEEYTDSDSHTIYIPLASGPTTGSSDVEGPQLQGLAVKVDTDGGPTHQRLIMKFQTQFVTKPVFKRPSTGSGSGSDEASAPKRPVLATQHPRPSAPLEPLTTTPPIGTVPPYTTRPRSGSTSLSESPLKKTKEEEKKNQEEEGDDTEEKANSKTLRLETVAVGEEKVFAHPEQVERKSEATPGKSTDAPEKESFEKEGKEKEGKEKEGKDKEGKDKEGKDKEGKDKEGKDKEGKDKEGKDKESMDKESMDKESKNKESNDKKSKEKELKEKESKEKESCSDTESEKSRATVSEPSTSMAATLESRLLASTSRESPVPKGKAAATKAQATKRRASQEAPPKQPKQRRTPKSKSYGSSQSTSCSSPPSPCPSTSSTSTSTIGASRPCSAAGRRSSFTMAGTVLDAPVFHPTEKEFQDPLEYFEKIRPAAEKFGLCRIVPPSTFKPDCCVNDEMRFTAYNQYIHKTLHRWGPNTKELRAIKKYLATQSIQLKQVPLVGGMEVDLPRLYATVQNMGGLAEVIERKRWFKVADAMRIPKSAQDRVAKLDDIYCKYLLPYDTLSSVERENLFDMVELEWSTREANLNKQSSSSSVSSDEEDSESESGDEMEECIVKGRSTSLSAFYRIARNTMSMWFKTPEPAAAEVEAEFWKHVRDRNHHVCVHSGSIDSGNSYGFPVKNSSFAKHPWNLKVLTNNTGSVLRSLGPVMGVTVPTLHVGMLFTTCCWYRDPHSLPWIEYLHTGASKIWYGIPDSESGLFREAVRDVAPQYVRDQTLWLASDTAMVPPPLLTEKEVTLSRTVQAPGQFVLVFPRSYISSICTGYLVSESVYFAPPSWLEVAHQTFKDMQDSCEPAMFSLERLMFSVAEDSRSSVDVLNQVLPVIMTVIENELSQRGSLRKLGMDATERLPLDGKGKRKGQKVDLDDYECEVCRASLYVSMVNWSQEETVWCLPHALEQITEQRQIAKQCKLLYTYSQKELNELLQNLLDRIEEKALLKPAAKASGSKSRGSSSR